MSDYKKTQIALHLNSLDYLHDYMAMGVDLLIVGGCMSTYTHMKLTDEEIHQLFKRLTHQKLYVLVNGLYDEHELDALHAHLDRLHEMAISGLIFQDFGVLFYCRQQGYQFDFLYHPLTLNTNGLSLQALQAYGVTSAFVAKEIPLEEQLAIREMTSMPLMLQVHGSQYIMSSKRRLLSTYREASGLSFDEDITIIPRDTSYPCHIYEDERGTSVFSVNRLYMLDLMNTIQVFDYLYIETLFMSPQEALEVTSIYCDCRDALRTQRYDQYVKEYLPLLRRISAPLDRGFIDDHTIYHLDDVKRRDANG